MTRVCTVLILLSAVATADEPPKKPPGTPAERLAALKKEHTDAEAAYYKALRELPDTPEGQKKAGDLWKAFDKDQGERFMAALEIARADPKAAAIPALEWVLTNPRAYYLPVGKPALEFAAEHYAADPRVGRIVAWVGQYTPHEQASPKEHEAAMRLVRAVLEKNPDKTARAQSALALASQAKRKFAVAEYRKAADAEALAAEAEKAFEALVKDYGDCPRLIREGSGTVGEFAGRELFELRNLRVGKVAPDIEGEDLDGKEFKLSDYRGKVVVLDFWGDW